MDIVALKEIFLDVFFEACIVSSIGLFTLWVLLKVFSRAFHKMVKRHGWVSPILFFIWSSWAAHTGFLSSEEKARYLNAQREQDAVNKVWGELITSSEALKRGETQESMLAGNEESLFSDANIDALVTCSLTEKDYERGFVLSYVGTNEVHDFTLASDGNINHDWSMYGAYEDWMYLSFNDWSFPFGTNDFSRFRIFSYGEIDMLQSATNICLTPFGPRQSIVPAANWHLLSHCPSQFWHELTLENTLKLTWQNALYNRETNTPISIQVEFSPNGDFIYRYDLSSINLALTSLKFRRIDQMDTPGSDADGDGLLLEDELFVYHTDQRNQDSDYDGISDGDEVLLYETNPNNPYSISDDYPDGLALKLNGLDPFATPEGSTNTFYEHIFYTSCTNAPFSYPKATEESAILKINVSGSGTGRLVIDDKVVPLLGSLSNNERTLEVSKTNTLLLAIGKASKKTFWISKPDSLVVSMDSDDLMIGEEPSLLRLKGWILFPHTQATEPCIHDFKSKLITVSLVHGEEVEGLRAWWQSESSQVAITNIPNVSADIRATFKNSQTREICYFVDHKLRLNSKIPSFVQTLRFCPQLTDDVPMVNPAQAGWEESTCDCSQTSPCICGDTRWWCHCQSVDCRCNENRPAAVTHDIEAEVAFTNIIATQEAFNDALYLYRDNERSISLEVPSGQAHNCCACEEHCKSNYVASVLYGEYANVRDLQDKAFSVSYNPCTVKVSGVLPSFAFNDSVVDFVTNSILYKRFEYTILGVKIAIPDDDKVIERYNELSPTLGYPVEVCENIDNAAGLLLKTDVLLTNGYVKISMENVSGEFKVCLPKWMDNHGYVHAEETLLDSNSRRSTCLSMGEWRSIVMRYTTRRELKVKILSSTPGACTLRLEYIASNGTNYVHDFDTQKITSINPLLLADYNRDGAIGAADVRAWLEGRPFRYWVNECRVVGSVWEEPSLFENIIHGLLGDDNWRNNKVDGAYDLINLFPIAVNFGPFLQQWGDGVAFKITSESGDDAFNYTLANISHQIAGSIRKVPHVDFYGNALTNAPLYELGEDGIVLTQVQAFDQCLLIAEAKKSRYGGLKLSVCVNGEELYCSRIPIRTSSVDEMFRFVNIRGSHENPIEVFPQIPSPSNNPDSELAVKDVFFVHGFNVSADAARDWNREMFKRFWVSGMNARYWGVTWDGDYHVALEAFNGLHYHRDVRQALMTAPTFRNLVNQHGHDAVVIGHSLGNMVVSEALLKGANAKTYIMLDAAVASEAYRPQLQGQNTELLDKYVPSDWDGYDSRTWAANWYTWFTNNTTDVRGELGWAGHFVPLLENQNLEVYNFYSSGDEVFAEAAQVPGLVTGMFHWPTFSLSWPFVDIDFTPDAFPWQKQEVFKGVNAAGSLSAGWGFHCWPTNVNGERRWYRYSPEGANALMENGSIVTNAVFDRGVSAMFKPDISDFEKADILAYHIPAVSSPAGKVISVGEKEDDGLDYNLNDEIYRINGWGRGSVENQDSKYETNIEYPWLHSDIKNMAYYFIYPAFDKILEKGNLK